MRRGVVAFDFDGTIADHERVPPELQQRLQRLRAEGFALFLVTGRRAESLDLGPLEAVFTGLVWENGAVLQWSGTDEFLLPFGALDPHLVDQLAATGAWLERGRAIVATSTEHEATVRAVIDAWGGGVSVVHNKGAVMLLPPGAAKGAGLERMLAICGYSPRDLVSFGDGENDLSLLGVADIGVAVADAVPSLLAAADLVSSASGPSGVLEVLEVLERGCDVLDDLDLQPRHRRSIPIGTGTSGDTVAVSCRALARGSLGVFGDSCSGKSFAAGLLAEGMHREGYQVIVIDPEGDHRGLAMLPGFVTVDAGGDGTPQMSPAVVVALADFAGVSVVLDLLSVGADERVPYVAAVLGHLRGLRTRRFRPHWILLDEAQHVLRADDDVVGAEMVPLLRDGGMALVSYCPDRLPPAVLGTLDQVLLTRLSDPGARASVREGTHGLVDGAPVDLRSGEVLVCDHRRRVPVRLRPLARRVPHVRHLHKYLNQPLPPHRRFHFRTGEAAIGVEASSLEDFRRRLATVPDRSIAHHAARGDFASWAAQALGDQLLAAQLAALDQRDLTVDQRRTALVQLVGHRCDELAAFA